MSGHTETIAAFGNRVLPLPAAFHGGVVTRVENGVVTRNGLPLVEGATLIAGDTLIFQPNTPTMPVYLTVATVIFPSGDGFLERVGAGLVMTPLLRDVAGGGEPIITRFVLDAPVVEM